MIQIEIERFWVNTLAWSLVPHEVLSTRESGNARQHHSDELVRNMALTYYKKYYV